MIDFISIIFCNCFHCLPCCVVSRVDSFIFSESLFVKLNANGTYPWLIILGLQYELLTKTLYIFVQKLFVWLPFLTFAFNVVCIIRPDPRKGAPIVTINVIFFYSIIFVKNYLESQKREREREREENKKD